MIIISAILFFLSIFFVYRMLYWKDHAEESEIMLFALRRIEQQLIRRVQELETQNKQLKLDNQELQYKLEKAMQDYWSKP